ncbi:hypothetical protein [Acidisphaera sp. S103]|nr:hypothetical protein [Acidisphaera sp. S103]
MSRWILFAFALFLLSACGNIQDKRLPTVSKDDPTWPLTPDHLEYGALPR